MDFWITMLGAVFVIWGMVWMLRNMDSNTAIVVTLAGVLLIFCSTAFAHDHTRPELNSWFKGLKNKIKTPCCDGNDGKRVDDADWESKDGHYRVRIDGKWLDVPDSAIVDGPNLAGHTMVWPITGYMGTTIRCFMPGPMT